MAIDHEKRRAIVLAKTPKTQTAPKRKMLSVDVLPRVKRRLDRHNAVFGFSTTRALEIAADVLERERLERLSEEQRPVYLAGQLTLKMVDPRRGLKPSDPAIPRIPLRAKVSVEAKEKLARLAAFYGVPVRDIIAFIAKKMEKGALGRLQTDEQRRLYLEDKLDPSAVILAVDQGSAA